MDRDCVNKRSLDLYKEVLWVSVDQRAAELSAIKDGGCKKNSARRPGSNPIRLCQEDRQNSFPTSNFDGW